MKPSRNRTTFLLISFFFILTFPITVFCQDPILSIDTGGHQAKIKGVMFTSDNRYLVSASYDKTVRVWDIQTGEIVRVIRGQIGNGKQGKLYAAALSPDDKWLAVAGLLPGDSSNRDSIRLIDFRTGEVKTLLKGHANVILGLSFSSGGKKLISGSFDKTARIWDVRSGKMLHELKGHTEFIYAVAFSPDGSKAITGSDDETLKLWDVHSGRLITTMKGHKGDVRSVGFTPDGQYILSGSKDKTIRMWKGNTGAFIKVLAEQNRNVGSLSISPNGSMVLSGASTGSGTLSNNVYSIPSGNKLRSFTKHNNIVLATAISPDNTLAATGDSGETAIYIWDLQTGAVKHKLVGNGQQIWSVGFAKDGKSIAWGATYKKYDLFGYGPLNQSFIIRSGRDFDLALGVKLKNDDDYNRGIVSVGPWSIRTPTGKIHKTLQILKNGNIKHEITRSSTSGFDHRSLTLTPDGLTVISGGGNGAGSSFNPETGKKQHQFVGHTGDVWGVACSPDSRLMVSGSIDQTVKLWEIDTGKLLLTIFHGTDNEWVAWTPAGYYTASVKGDDYIGWHINQGKDKAALYYPGSRFADKFYSPDITARYIATGGNLEKAIQLVNQAKPKPKRIKKTSIQDVATMLPPTVIIQTPSERNMTVPENKVHVKAWAKSVTSDPVKDIWVLVNGRRLDNRAIKVAPRKQTGGLTAELDIWVPLTETNNRISVLASNRHGRSKAETFNVTWKQTQTASVKNLYKPDLYLLSIGVSQYQDPQYSLDYADKDAKGIASVLASQQGKLYNRVHQRLLTNQDATRKNIQKSLEWMYQESTQKDLSVIFIAGHGMKDTRDNYYFLPHEGDPESLLFSGVKWFDFQDIVSSLPSKVILMVDTCHSGSVTGKRRGISDITDALRDLMSSDSGVVVMTASTGKEVSQERSDWGHGAFTKAVIEGLRGKADYNSDGIVDMKEIDLYTTQRVKTLTGGSQHPTTEIPKTMPNFPLVVN